MAANLKKARLVYYSVEMTRSGQYEQVAIRICLELWNERYLTNGGKWKNTPPKCAESLAP
jgi:hypothetical protein